MDTSDHEVNIKILLAGAIASGEIRTEERGELLHAQTDEVAAHVLRHNDGQNMALAVARHQAPRLLHVHARYLRQLARQKRVSLQGDGLPGEKEIAARRSAGTGLTTPELALLLAHTKIAAGQQVLGSDLPDDPVAAVRARRVLPGASSRERFADQLGAHRLRREIITTSVINEMVDTGGSTFLFRLGEETGLPVPDITRAWLVAREVFGMSAFWQQVDALAGVVDVDARIAVVLEARKLVERATRWLLVNRRPPFGIAETAGFFADGVAAVRSALPKVLSGPGPGRLRGTARLLRRARRARGPGRRGGGDGAVVLGVRHRDERVGQLVRDRRDRGGLLRGGGPAPARAAAGTSSSRCRARTAGRRCPGRRCATTCTARTPR